MGSFGFSEIVRGLARWSCGLAPQIMGRLVIRECYHGTVDEYKSWF